MKQMFKCENGTQFSLDDCIMVSVLSPNEARELCEDDGEAYYAKVHIVGRQNISPVCDDNVNIVRNDYDRLVDVKEMFKCENGNLFSLGACISKSVLGPESVKHHFEEEGETYYAKLHITDVLKKCIVQCNITREDYDRLSKVYTDPMFGNRI